MRSSFFSFSGMPAWRVIALAALRWHSRYCREVRDATLAEATAVLALLAGFADGAPAVATRALAELLDARELKQPARPFRWASSRQDGRAIP
jgi:hypothetical protein